LNIWALRLSLLIIAGFSAVSSVAGLGAVFKGTYWPIVIVGIGLEIGKLATTAYAYTNWRQLSLRFKIGLVTFITAISLFTSAGIFGYLGDSFSKVHISAKKINDQSEQLQIDRKRLEDRLTEIDKQVAELPKEFVNGRLKLMAAFDSERKEIRQELREIAPKLASARIEGTDSQQELGPVVYIAEQFGTTVENAVGNMMMALTLLLDPFALFLTILCNRPKQVKVEEKVEPVKKRVRKAKVVKEKPVETTVTDWRF
jgi:hypothetical protein